MTLNDGSRRLPALRPLACGVMLALTALPASSLMARNLDGESETIDENVPAEDWNLTNGADLTVNNGNTHIIMLHDSTATLNGATVTRTHANGSQHSLDLRGDSAVTATNTQLVGGAVMLNGDSSIHLTGSSITVDETAPGMGTAGLQSFGISIHSPGATGTPTAVLDSTSIRVADNPGTGDLGSGIGVYMLAGGAELRNGSRIDADNMGVLMYGQDSLAHDLKFSLDNSHIASGRAAGIHVLAGASSNNRYDIAVHNGSTISAGNGNLLYVAAFNGQIATGDHRVTFTVDDSDLHGDIVFDDARMAGNSRVDVVLRNNASVRGRFSKVTSATVDSHGSWTLTGDSSVGDLTLGASGNVRLGDGQSFNTLSLDSFEGAGGTLLFNTVLGDDASATDKLVISGDATGQAGVQVNNAGGQGAQTVDGIELISIGGASMAQFDLVGRAVGGQYEYFLFKAANGNWYLRSELPLDPVDPVDPVDPIDPIDPIDPVDPIDPIDPVDPIDPIDPVDPVDPIDPTDPVTPEPKPVLRPETGAYLANDTAMGELLAHRSADRAATGTADGLRTWASAGASGRRMDAVGQQSLRTDLSRVQIGADIGVFDDGNGRLGALLTAGRADTTSRSVVTGYRAQGEVEGGAVGVYAGWNSGQPFVDTSLQRGRFSNKVQGDGLQQERYKAQVSQASVEAGHRFNAGRIGNLTLTLQPELQVAYTRTSMDTHTESNGTVIERVDGNGLRTRAGARLLGSASVGSLQWQPYLSLHAVHTDATPAFSFDGEVIEGGAPRRALELGAGTQLQIGNRLSARGGIHFSDGSDRYRETGAKLGVTYRW